MAIDTRNKRASCIGIDGVYRTVYPDPDGTIDQADRQQSAGKYSGILADPPGGTTLMALERATFRRVFGRVFGRMN